MYTSIYTYYKCIYLTRQFAHYTLVAGTAAGALGPAASGQGADTAEFVLLEPIPERLLLAATAGAVNATDPDIQLTELTCLQCNCCLKNTNPQVCLTTCCYQRICGESVCSIPEVVSCGCNHCVPPSHHSHRPSPLPPRTN